jgi:hypothetical protein
MRFVDPLPTAPSHIHNPGCSLATEPNILDIILFPFLLFSLVLTSDETLHWKYLFVCLLFPQQEKDRMDIYHKIFEVARRNILHTAPFDTTNLNDRPRILDVGCGTGIWAIDMAE